MFPVFDKLLQMCADVINGQVLVRCIEALIDKGTPKTKNHKASLTQFMKILMEVKIKARGQNAGERKSQHPNNNNHFEEEEEEDLEDDHISVHSKNNYFEIMCHYCFFANEDPSSLPSQRLA